MVFGHPIIKKNKNQLLHLLFLIYNFHVLYEAKSDMTILIFVI